MRIRSVKPSFWADAKIADLAEPTRLFYVGLWMVADDAGWFRWDVREVARDLYGYESPRRREVRSERMFNELVTAGRVVLHPCNCLHIPHLVDHQKIGGNRSLIVRDKHQVHTRMDESARNVRVSNGTVGNGNGGLDENGLTEFRARVPRPVVA